MSAPARTPASDDRRAHILDAAERAFMLRGFHRATMQDVAQEAQMSPGNLYRYFSSKEEIVEGLVERDRARIAQDFAMLDRSPDPAAAFAAISRGYIIEQPRERAVLALEIWAEAARNPKVAALCGEVENEVAGHLERFFRAGQARGEVAASVEPRSLVRLMMMLVDGYLRARATNPEFEAESVLHAGMIFGVMDAAAKGRIATGPTPLDRAAA